MDALVCTRPAELVHTWNMAGNGCHSCSNKAVEAGRRGTGKKGGEVGGAEEGGGGGGGGGGECYVLVIGTWSDSKE